MKSQLGALACATCLSVLSACAPSTEGAGGQPADVLLVSLDTLRADRLSCYGSPRDTTPFLDGLAERGVRAAQALSPSSQTAPSHMSLFSGLHPLGHGVKNVSAGADECFRIANSRTTLPELLAEADYTTAIFSDGGNVLPNMGFDRGFESRRFVLGEVRATLESVRQWLGGVDEDEPVFLFFHTYTTHSPYLPPRGYRGRYTDSAYRGEFRRRYEQLEGKPRLETFTLAARFLDPFEGMGDRDVEFLSNLYDETVAFADDITGRLFSAFDQFRDLDNTLTIVLSDHGEEFFEHGSLGHKRGLYRELVHVPLLMNGPGLGPHVIEEPLDLTGLLATVTEFLGLEVPQDVAPSFLPALRGAPLDRPAHQQLSLGPTAGRWRATVAEDARLLVHDFPRAEEPGLDPEIELFALSDRSEVSALPGDPREPRLTGLLDERAASDVVLIREAIPTRVSVVGDTSQRALQALGYLDDPESKGADKDSKQR